MAKNRRKIDAAVQERLGEVAAELRQMIYGEQGFPECGTKFAQIEDEGMAVGFELARVLMEQSVSEQATHMPEEDLDCPEETAQPAGTDRPDVKTQAGDVEWDEPAAYLNKARRAFFPS
ncbi:MAG: hypothetical protein ACE5KM_12785, partial [Planctomycetaceae bacterium]